jgi:hypothetical protein
VKIFRNAKPKFNAVYNEAKENAIDPKDKATLDDLKRKLAKASEEDNDAAFVAAQKQYDDFLDKIATKTNAKVRIVRNHK